MYKKYSKNVGNGSYLSTEFTVIVFLGRHSAREIHSGGSETEIESKEVMLRSIFPSFASITLLMASDSTEGNISDNIFISSSEGTCTTISSVVFFGALEEMGTYPRHILYFISLHSFGFSGAGIL